MKNALLVVSGVVLGLIGAIAAAASNRGVIPQAEAQSTQAENGTPPVVMAVGGSSPNVNDLCWLLFRDKGRDRAGEHDRWALCLYRAEGGKAFDLIDMREVTWDFKPSQLNVPGHKDGVRPQAMKELWEKAKKEEEKARKEREEADAKKGKDKDKDNKEKGGGNGN